MHCTDDAQEAADSFQITKALVKFLILTHKELTQTSQGDHCGVIRAQT